MIPCVALPQLILIDRALFFASDMLLLVPSLFSSDYAGTERNDICSAVQTNIRDNFFPRKREREIKKRMVLSQISLSFTCDFLKKWCSSETKMELASSQYSPCFLAAAGKMDNNLTRADILITSLTPKAFCVVAWSGEAAHGPFGNVVPKPRMVLSGPRVQI